MKLAISSTGSFSLMQLGEVHKIHFGPFRASIEVGSVFDVLGHSRFS
jgi:hypothetical protein